MAGQALTSSKTASNLTEFRDYLDKRKTALSQVAARHMNTDQVLKVVLNCVTKTPALQNCTLQSIFRSVLQSVELGLVPGSALGHAYLVPYGQECTLIPGYRGLIDLMRRTGDVSTITAQAVYGGDEFDYEFGLEPRLKHKPAGEVTDANLTHAYCVVKFKDGGAQFGVLNRKQIDAIRARSRSGNRGPWVTDYAAMAIKTAIRQVAKLCPMSIEVSKALAVDESSERGDMSFVAELDSTTVQAQFEDDEPKAAPTAAPEPASTRALRNAVNNKKAEAAPAPEPVAQAETIESVFDQDGDEQEWTYRDGVAALLVLAEKYHVPGINPLSPDPSDKERSRAMVTNARTYLVKHDNWSPSAAADMFPDSWTWSSASFEQYEELYRVMESVWSA